MAFTLYLQLYAMPLSHFDHCHNNYDTGDHSMEAITMFEELKPKAFLDYRL
jgi:hypothetical protein